MRHFSMSLLFQFFTSPTTAEPYSSSSLASVDGAPSTGLSSLGELRETANTTTQTKEWSLRTFSELVT